MTRFHKRGHKLLRPTQAMDGEVRDDRYVLHLCVHTSTGIHVGVGVCGCQQASACLLIVSVGKPVCISKNKAKRS